jgi:hypothetical protein
MSTFIVTQKNLPEAIEFALSECSLQLVATQKSRATRLQFELEFAIRTLKRIDSQLKSESVLSRVTSSGFGRYVVDGEPQMDAGLIDLVMSIEDMYERRYRRMAKTKK